jgi:hypothetical protein
MRGRPALVGLVLLVAAVLSAIVASAALAAFPYTRGGQTAFDDFYLGPNDNPPPDLNGDEQWYYPATPEAAAPPDPLGIELGYVRGSHVVDAADAPETAWELTTGRPDVVIAVHDSGIEWSSLGAMRDIRFKTRLNTGELPEPNTQRAASLVDVDGTPGADPCAGADATDGDYDTNNDGIVDLRDYACDTRVNVTDGRRAGPSGFLTPQDLLLAFSDSDDDDSNGFDDDIVGWDFLDDDNDPYDDVHYGHGTGEAQDSGAEAANDDGGAGSCPNCMVMHIRVGDSFVADVNRFARGVIYSVDSGALVVQEALGTLNNTRFARQAVNYAYDHGVAVMASAADEAAQHNNWPSSLPHTIVTNAVVKYTEFTPNSRSYLQFSHCTNFSAKISISVPSDSCSSGAVGYASGMAGLLYSAALNAHERGDLQEHPDCTRVVDEDGTPGLDPCVISANEVRQLMASGSCSPRATCTGADGTNQSVTQADDVDFMPGVEPACGAAPA